MDKEIKELKERSDKIEQLLYEKVIDIDNHMNDCDCDNCVKYNFINLLFNDPIEDFLFCLNCGGFIQAEG